MKKTYNTPDMKLVSFEVSDIITSSTGMTLGTFTTGIVLGGDDFGEFNETGF